MEVKIELYILLFLIISCWLNVELSNVISFHLWDCCEHSKVLSRQISSRSFDVRQLCYDMFSIVDVNLWQHINCHHITQCSVDVFLLYQTFHSIACLLSVIMNIFISITSQFNFYHKIKVEHKCMHDSLQLVGGWYWIDKVNSNALQFDLMRFEVEVCSMER